MAINISPTREKFPLSTKKVLKKTFAGTLVLTIILLVLYGVVGVPILLAGKDTGALFGFVTLLLLGVLGLIIGLTYLYQRWYYQVYYYDLNPDYIVIKKGPITPREITIPYERVQDVYVDQDLFDRFFGLYDVHLSSATVASGMEAHIDGVEKTAADGLRTLLLETVSDKISRHRNTAPPPPPPPPPAVAQPTQSIA